MWENVVTCCRSCNTQKGNKTLQKLGLKLKKQPHIPSNYELKEIGRMFPPNFYIKVGMIFFIGIQSLSHKL